jgi:hypothetical protein
MKVRLRPSPDKSDYRNVGLQGIPVTGNPADWIRNEAKQFPGLGSTR